MKSIKKMVTVVSEENYKSHHVLHNTDGTGVIVGEPPMEALLVMKMDLF